MQNHFDDITEYLRSRGYRATPQRVNIYEALCTAGSHPTVTVICEKVREKDPTISIATVYKTLQLFLEIGLVTEMGFKDESVRYDPRMEDHLNLICTRCGCIEDFRNDKLDDLAASVTGTTGFAVVSRRFEMQGLCSSCQKQSTPGSRP